MARDPECAETLETGSPFCFGGFEACDGLKMGSQAGSGEPVVVLEGCRAKKEDVVRAEIDTSSPFESVKEAANRFGGFGFWRPHHNKLPEAEHEVEEFDMEKVEEQAAQLEKDLIVKEREALEVLKELETTRLVVEELKLRLPKEKPEGDAALMENSDDTNENLAMKEVEKKKHENFERDRQNLAGGLDLCPSSTPGLILMELKQAKLNLTRTTNDLTNIRASVESYKKKIEKERISLEKTRERLTSNSSKISSIEQELNQTRQKLQVTKDAEINSISDCPTDISRELQRLSSEADKFKKMGEAAKSDVLRAMSEIEQTKTQIKTAEIGLIAAKKMKEAAIATEAVALAEIKAISHSESSSGVLSQKSEGVTLSFEEYSSLTCKARVAEELSKRRVIDAMFQVDEANISKMEILKRVEEATKEVIIRRKALEEALSRVEAANRGKLAVEEALRKWRSEHGQKRRSVHKSTKFKNSYLLHHRRDSSLVDVNGLNVVRDDSVPVLKPALSIGQILSRKLMMTEEFETGVTATRNTVKRKVSLGQLLNKRNGDLPSFKKADRESSQKQQFPTKRRKFGFARFSVLLTKQSKKKKPTPNSR